MQKVTLFKIAIVATKLTYDEFAMHGGTADETKNRKKKYILDNFEPINCAHKEARATVLHVHTLLCH